MTTFLKFENEGAFYQALSALGLSPAAEIKGDGFALSVIGLIPDGGYEPVLNKQYWLSHNTPPEDQKGLPDDVVLASGGEQKPDGTVYKKGERLMQPTYIDGWHVNLLGELPEGWDAMTVEVNSPVRIFG